MKLKFDANKINFTIFFFKSSVLKLTQTSSKDSNDYKVNSKIRIKYAVIAFVYLLFSC